MKKWIAVALGAIALFAATPTQAHHIPARDAESRWYYLFQHRCGDGLVWNTCWNRKFYLNAGPRTGDHGWYLDYWFVETTNWMNRRTCSVSGRLKHTTIYGEVTEDCWG